MVNISDEKVLTKITAPVKDAAITKDAAATRRACCYANGQDSPDGATVSNKVTTKSGANSHIQYTLALMCAKIV